MSEDDRIARLLAVVEAQGAQLVALTSMLSADRVGPKSAPVASITIAEVFKGYREVRRAEKSWGVIEDRLLPLVRLRGDLPANELTPAAWKAYRFERQKESVKAEEFKAPSSTTLNLELSRAKTMLTWATQDEQKFIKVNPLRDAKRDRPKAPRRSWLGEDVLQKILCARFTKVDGAILAFRAWTLVMADTGLRFNEARKLRRDRIRELADDEILADIPETKNGKSHVVGLTSRAMAALDRVPEVGTSPFFFANPLTGRLYCVSTMWRWFRLAAEKAKIDGLVADGELRFRPHDCRRSAASNAHARGADLLEIQDMLNHSNPSVTAQYVQRNERGAVRMAKLMERGALAERQRKPAVSARVVPSERRTAKSTRSGSA